jgi:hypothetical protein
MNLDIAILLIIFLIILNTNFTSKNEKFGLTCGSCKFPLLCNWKKGYCTFLGW